MKGEFLSLFALWGFITPFSFLNLPQLRPCTWRGRVRTMHVGRWEIQHTVTDIKGYLRVRSPARSRRNIIIARKEKSQLNINPLLIYQIATVAWSASPNHESSISAGTQDERKRKKTLNRALTTPPARPVWQRCCCCCCCFEQNTHLLGTSSPLHGVAATIQLLVSRLAPPHCPSLLLFTRRNFSPRELSDKSIPQGPGGAISRVPSLWGAPAAGSLRSDHHDHSRKPQRTRSGYPKVQGARADADERVDVGAKAVAERSACGGVGGREGRGRGSSASRSLVPSVRELRGAPERRSF